jgi:signal transduction histidine kinase
MEIGASILPAKRVPRVDVDRLALSALVVAMLAVAVAFTAYRLVTPSDGTALDGSGNAYTAVGVTVEPRPGDAGSTPIEPDDRVTAMLGRSVGEWAGLLLDPGVQRPIIRDGESIDYSINRGGRPFELIVTATPFDPITALAEDWGVIILALSIQLVGVYLFARRPAEPAARALLVVGTGMFASTVPWALGLQVTDLVTASGFWLYMAAAGVAYTVFWCGALHFALVFPRPHRFVRGRRHLVTIAYVLPIATLLLLTLAVGFTSGGALPAMSAWRVGQAVQQVVVVVTTVILMGYSYFRLTDPVSRSQLRWLAGATALAAITNLLFWFGPELMGVEPLIPRSAVALFALPFPIALGMAVSRHHLFDLDTVVNRSLVYGGLTAGILLTYALTVTLIGGLIPGDAPYAVALLGAGAVAVVALPLRDRMQRSVNRLMYGDRDDPDRALRRLGRRLEASLDPQTVLPTLVDAVAEAMRSPYVAIELERDGETRAEAAHGSVPIDVGGPRDPVRLPIVYRGQPVGRLVVVPRAANEPFSPADLRLLADLARQSGPAVEAVRLTGDLRRSREELVATREEERRRLRRDLHDELGPALAGSLMKLGAARSLMASEPARAGELLDDLEGDARGMIDEIRRMARDLRPPALDELGLLGVLRQRIATFDEGTGDGHISVSFDAPSELPALPAAVEVAALRIALEGLTNAARHSRATCARVCVALEGDALMVSVTDDGIGVASDTKPGVGLASMRERADELGGSLSIDTPDGGGTLVLARLPLVIARPS